MGMDLFPLRLPLAVRADAHLIWQEPRRCRSLDGDAATREEHGSSPLAASDAIEFFRRTLRKRNATLFQR